METTGALAAERRERARDEIIRIVVERAIRDAKTRCVGPDFEALVDAVTSRDLDPYAAARKLEE
jgi:hypothetical protein